MTNETITPRNEEEAAFLALLEETKAADAKLKAAGVWFETTQTLNGPRTLVGGSTFKIKDTIRALGGKWNRPGKFWEVIPGKFDSIALAEAL